MSAVASKNLFELLGNDPPSDDDSPKKLPREVVKSVTSSRKREEKVAPSAAAPTTGYSPRGNGRGRGGRYSGNEAAYRDRDAGRDSNRTKVTGEGVSPRGGSGRGRGGRGGRREFDRHSATGINEHEKQAARGWGGAEGTSEWDDERAGEELAKKDAAGENPEDPNVATDAPAEGEAAEPSEEDKTKTYDAYLAERANRAMELGPPQEVRRPNEGSRDDKKWAKAKVLENEETEYFAGEFKDKKSGRDRKLKKTLDIEPRYVEERGGRRGDRGGRGRGEGRGGRGGRGSGERGAFRGGDRGDRHERGSERPHRGGPRGGSSTVNVDDQSAFPSLGA